MAPIRASSRGDAARGFDVEAAGFLGEGRAFARMLVAKFPDAPEFVDIHASFHEQKKNYAKAYEIVKAGLKRHGNEERLHTLRAPCSSAMGDRKKAIASMRRVLELK